MSSLAREPETVARVVYLRELVEDGRRYSDGSLPGYVVGELAYLLQELELDLIIWKQAA